MLETRMAFGSFPSPLAPSGHHELTLFKKQGAEFTVLNYLLAEFKIIHAEIFTLALMMANGENLVSLKSCV